MEAAVRSGGLLIGKLLRTFDGWTAQIAKVKCVEADKSAVEEKYSICC